MNQQIQTNKMIIFVIILTILLNISNCQNTEIKSIHEQLYGKSLKGKWRISTNNINNKKYILGV